MKLLIISLCTTGVMREHFIEYAKKFSCCFDTYCITNDNISKEELLCKEVLNLSYKRQKKISYFSIKKIKLIKKFIKYINPDRIIIFTPHPTNIPISLFIKKYNVIYQVHDPIPHSGTKLLEKILLKLQHRIYYKISKIILVAGENVKEQVLASTKLKIENKIRSVYFALLPSNIFEIPIETKDIDILFFGRIEYYKGLDILFNALEALNRSINCYIVGKGDINKAYDDIKIPKNVKFDNNYVSNKELAKYIMRSKIVVLPYRDATGSMTVGISFYYGTPVIASNVGVFSEYVGDGGIIFEKNNYNDLANKINALLSSEALRVELSSNARNIYRSKFDIDVVIEKNVNILKEL